MPKTYDITGFQRLVDAMPGWVFKEVEANETNEKLVRFAGRPIGRVARFLAENGKSKIRVFVHNCSMQLPHPQILKLIDLANKNFKITGSIIVGDKYDKPIDNARYYFDLIAAQACGRLKLDKYCDCPDWHNKDVLTNGWFNVLAYMSLSDKRFRSADKCKEVSSAITALNVAMARLTASDKNGLPAASLFDGDEWSVRGTQAERAGSLRRATVVAAGVLRNDGSFDTKSICDPARDDVYFILKCDKYDIAYGTGSIMAATNHNGWYDIRGITAFSISPDKPRYQLCAPDKELIAKAISLWAGNLE